MNYDHEAIAAELCDVLPPPNERKVRLYLARAMSGRKNDEVVAEAADDKAFFEACGFEVLCPVNEEGVKASSSTLITPKDKMVDYWFNKDKPMIRYDDVTVNCTAMRLSFGVIHEMVLARGVYWKPTAWLFPEGTLPHEGNIVYFEGDIVTDSRVELARKMYELYGTRRKRLLWRLKLLNRCLPTWIWDQITFLFELRTRGCENIQGVAK
jgi:hypothetical protein